MIQFSDTRRDGIVEADGQARPARVGKSISLHVAVPPKIGRADEWARKNSSQCESGQGLDQGDGF